MLDLSDDNKNYIIQTAQALTERIDRHLPIYPVLNSVCSQLNNAYRRKDNDDFIDGVCYLSLISASLLQDPVFSANVQLCAVELLRIVESNTYERKTQFLALYDLYAMNNSKRENILACTRSILFGEKDANSVLQVISAIQECLSVVMEKMKTFSHTISKIDLQPCTIGALQVMNEACLDLIRENGFLSDDTKKQLNRLSTRLQNGIGKYEPLQKGRSSGVFLRSSIGCFYDIKLKPFISVSIPTLNTEHQNALTKMQEHMSNLKEIAAASEPSSSPKASSH